MPRLLDVLFAFILVALLLLLGRLVKQKIPLFQKLYLPESIIAGFIALILGPGVVGAIARTVGGDETLLATGFFPEATRTVWSQSPGVFINIVFAALFIGETIPHPRDIWRKAAPQVAFGQSLAWGQYVVGLLLALLVLVPLFQVDPIAGALIEIAFEGGHGTAAGMGDTFRELGFEAGPDLALGLATVGIVSGVISGIILADWGRRKGYVQTVSVESTDPALHEERHVEDRDTRLARMRLMENLLIDPLSLNFGFVGAAIVIGWLILQALRLIESVTWGAAGFELIRYVPLFPMALIGGLVVQLVMERLGLAPLIIRRLQERIAGVALDVVVVTALASINLTILGANLGVFLTLSIAGIIWNVWAFLYLGPRLLPTYWFERGIGDLGQSMGVTATGILLIRMVDPDNRTGAFESFAYKQLFFEPIVGGGLFTAAAPPLIRQFGPIPILILTTLLLAFWIGFGLLNYKRIALRSEQQAVEQENTLSR
ncbi:sodium:glutamate symporter [Desertifilum sp. FACHB-1129]|uniref:Sodium:glutamate symporter n=1 Tax=Desertifilum tharense IPPAS B-1220 TaxID=1781255 RepID=A0A1E5QFG7_9CYAN|nr:MULTISPECIES: sodium/glutamate symporter [Desertifilum]MDA0208921.1 sodium:glutamate symporter [Cyanobacteria bacterium FC1]MBD2310404.1 sodium:glutamate symporter [Desertifilum sp. FACHB-1129]MBD2321856.1 sodium:glutamate symporter [Desertifilum sp. FACHB-866]MBD2331983.1 sodium:glutamate symporter [Desertifilum sp. FACHB-868]OEJ73425.1 sodium:glutamate symporter [Desertifilum tharense IPPAS B-1220]